MSNREEIFVDIQGWEERYQISNHGRVKSKEYKVRGRYEGTLSTRSEAFLKCHIQNSGYMATTFQNGALGKKPQTLYIHRLVAEHFLNNPEGHEDVHHRDLDRTNNHVNNLMWMPDGYGSTLYAAKESKKDNRPIYAYTYPSYRYIHKYESSHDVYQSLGERPSISLNGQREYVNGYHFNYNLLTEDELIQKRDEAYRVYVYTFPKLDFVGRYHWVKDCGEAMNLNPSHISKVLNGGIAQLKGYHFSHTKIEDKEVIENTFYKIFKYKDGELVGKYVTYQEIEGYNPNQISMAVNGYRQNSYKGYHWYNTLQ